jgi:elongation factor 3
MVIIDPPKETLSILRQALNVSDEDEEESMEILAYVATLAASLASTQDFDSSTWVEALTPYIADLPNAESTDDTIEKFRALTEKATDSELDDESDEEDEFGGEELCNIRFSLAYGGKILLHQTKLRLRRGHRYALVGQNG